MDLLSNIQVMIIENNNLVAAHIIHTGTFVSPVPNKYWHAETLHLTSANQIHHDYWQKLISHINVAAHYYHSVTALDLQGLVVGEMRLKLN